MVWFLFGSRGGRPTRAAAPRRGAGL